MRTDFLSELIAIGAPNRLPVSLLGVAFTGLALLFGARALWVVWRPAPWGRTMAMLLVLSGIAYVGIAAAPCDPGCSTADMGPRMVVHLISGLVAMGTLVLAGLVAGVFVFEQPRWRLPLLVSAGIGLLALAVLVGAPVPAVGRVAATYPGAVQRVAQLGGDVSLVLIALASLRAARLRPQGTSGDAG